MLIFMEIYHVLSRGVDGRKIFLETQDYFRFIHDLFEFNDQDRVNTTFRLFRNKNDIGCRTVQQKRKPRKMLVDILAFSLMPNHYHLMLIPRTENGVPKFMKKLNMGFVKYFNHKYKRRGTLFEGRYKSVLVKEHAHFVHLPYYIHLNPLDLMAPEWRERKLNNYKKAIEFLNSYRWSSHLDYLGKKNFPSVTRRELLLKFFDGKKGYERSIEEWLKDLSKEEFAEKILLE